MMIWTQWSSSNLKVALSALRAVPALIRERPFHVMFFPIGPTTLLVSTRNVPAGSEILFCTLRNFPSGLKIFFHRHKCFLRHPEKCFRTLQDFRRTPEKVFRLTGNVLHPSKTLFHPVQNVLRTSRIFFVIQKNVLILKMKVTRSIRSFGAVQKRVFDTIWAFFGVQPFLRRRQCPCRDAQTALRLFR